MFLKTESGLVLGTEDGEGLLVEATPIYAEMHWYIASYAVYWVGHPPLDDYSDCVAGTTGSKYISTAQDEGAVVGQVHAYFAVNPSDTWGAFETFIQFDTRSVSSAPATAKARFSFNIYQIQFSQDLLLATHDWGGGQVDATNWRTPTQLAALTEVGSIPIDGFGLPGAYFDIDVDPSAIVLGGYTRLMLFTSNLRDAVSPGNLGDPTANDDLFLEPLEPGGGGSGTPMQLLLT